MGGVVAGNSHGNSFILGHDDSVGCPGDDDGDSNTDWDPVRVTYSAGSNRGQTIFRKEFYKPDVDELGNCDDMDVKNIVDYGLENFRMSTESHYKYRYLVDALVENGTNKIDLNTQQLVDTFEIDLGRGAKMTAYAGNGFVRGEDGMISEADNPNELSLSFLVTYGDFDFLISGDLIGKHNTKWDSGRLVEVERSSTDAHLEKLVGRAVKRDRGKIEILHVDHHGADNASETEFLELINPDIAIISSGNGNKYDHPTNATLERLVDAGVYRIIQTSWGNPEDKVSEDVRERQAIYQSDVVIYSNGDHYYITTGRWFDASRDYSPE